MLSAVDEAVDDALAAGLVELDGQLVAVHRHHILRAHAMLVRDRLPKRSAVTSGNWPEILQQLLRRKFGSGYPDVDKSSGQPDSSEFLAKQKARQKLQRFVLSRGFTLEQLARLPD